MNEAQAGGAQARAALRQQIGQGFALLRQGRVDEGVRLAEVLIAGFPGNGDVAYLASEAHLAAGDAEKAYQDIEVAIAAAPDQSILLMKKAHLLMVLLRRAEALQTAKEAEQFVGNDVEAARAIGRFYSKCNDPVSALAIYQAMLANAPDSTELRYDLAATQFYLGDFSGAEANLGKYLDATPDAGHALYLRATLRRQTEADNHIPDLQSRLGGKFSSTGARAACLFALAKELEDLGRYDESFQALTEGASTKRRTLTFDLAPELAAIEAIRTAYTPEVIQAGAAGFEDKGVIFIVGMPRTGTTLVEQILCRHSDVQSAGELLGFGQVLAAAAQKIQAAQGGASLVEASLEMDFAALGRDYMRGARQAAPDSRLFIDKLPVNYLYCGIIKKALPNARIVHLVRDPMDSCYAIYKTLFNQAYYFSYDLDELADYYIAYHRLMEHWRQAMPGAILDMRYEELVQDPDTQIRRLIEGCGLEWQAAVLDPSGNKAPIMTASAAQVREPIHARSVQRWRDYEAGLAQLKARLQAAGVVKD